MNKILLSIFLLTACIGAKPEKEINYLPKGYIGKVAVIFDQIDGRRKEYVGDRRVYKIPPCGILKTIFQEPGSIIYDSDEIDGDVLFVYADSDRHNIDTLHFLPYFKDVNSIAYKNFLKDNQNKVFVFEWGYGGFSFDSTKYDHVESYIVDTLKNKNKYKYKQFNSGDFAKCTERLER